LLCTWVVAKVRAMRRLISTVGRATLRTVGGLVGYIGGVAVLALDTLRAVFIAPIRWRMMLQQIVELGFRSQAVVMITGGFTGAVFAAQAFFQFRVLGMESAVGAVVSVSMCRELGPVLTGLMLAGRVGASMSAEIGTMKVTEQIDALRALAVYPVDYLVVPRALAMFVSVPLLAGECIGFGILAGYFVAVDLLGVQGPYYIDNMIKFMTVKDVFMGLIKGLVFGMLIVFISCYEGLHAQEGAVGVGRATTEAVVTGSLAILISNFFLTMFLNIFFPGGV
jgi:phospholipid/cholesterol/gamma-HCH transport system permease protein